MENLMTVQVCFALCPSLSALTLTFPNSFLPLQNQLVGSDDRNNWNDLQGNLCSVITVSRVSYPRRVACASLC